MAVKYWYRPNNGSSNYNTTGSWFLGSGGTGGSTSNPTSADDVILDSNSGTGTLTISATASCRSFNSSTFRGTLSGNSQFSVTTAALTNQVILSLGGTHNFTGRLVVNGSANNGLIYFNGRYHNGAFDFTSTAKFIADRVFCAVTTINLADVTYTGGISTGLFTFSSGIIEFARNTVNNIGNFVSNGINNVRTLILNNAIINLNGNDTIWNVNGISQGTLTISQGESTINIKSVPFSNAIFIGGGGNYANLNIDRGGFYQDTAMFTTFQGLNTAFTNFRDLTVLAPSSQHFITFPGSSNLTPIYFESTFQVGNSVNRTIVRSSSGSTCNLYKYTKGLVICPNTTFENVYAYNDFAFWYGISGSSPSGGGGGIIFNTPPRRLGSLSAG
jgi:hypothetical protein